MTTKNVWTEGEGNRQDQEVRRNPSNPRTCEKTDVKSLMMMNTHCFNKQFRAAKRYWNRAHSHISVHIHKTQCSCCDKLPTRNRRKTTTKKNKNNNRRQRFELNVTTTSEIHINYCKGETTDTIAS